MKWVFLSVFMGLPLCGGLRSAEGRPPALEWREFARESFQRDGEGYSFERRRLSFDSGCSGEGRWGWGYRHDYRVFRFPDTEQRGLIGNGHVHQTGPQVKMKTGSMRFQFEPALAVSSNVLRDQRDMRLQDVEPAFTVVHLTPAPGRGDWLLGLAGDSRMGEYRLYPVLAWQSFGSTRMSATLGFPDSALQWQVAERWRIHVEWGPDGGEWLVRSRDFSQTVAWREERWRVRVGGEWNPVPAMSLGVFWDHAFQRKWSARSKDSERIEVYPPDSGITSLQFRIYF